MSETISVVDISAAAEAVSNTNKKVIFKHYVPFIDCINEINNTKVDNARDIDIVIPMYNLTECSNNYFKNLQVYDNTLEMNHL